MACCWSATPRAGVSAERRRHPAGDRVRPVRGATIVEAAGRYTRGRLQGYDTWLREKFAASPVVRAMSQLVPAAVWMPLARRLLGNRAFVRSVVLNRGFLRP